MSKNKRGAKQASVVCYLYRVGTPDNPRWFGVTSLRNHEDRFCRHRRRWPGEGVTVLCCGRRDYLWPVEEELIRRHPSTDNDKVGLKFSERIREKHRESIKASWDVRKKTGRLGWTPARREDWSRRATERERAPDGTFLPKGEAA